MEEKAIKEGEGLMFLGFASVCAVKSYVDTFTFTGQMLHNLDVV